MTGESCLVRHFVTANWKVSDAVDTEPAHCVCHVRVYAVDTEPECYVCPGIKYIFCMWLTHVHMCNAVPLAMKEYGKKLLEVTHEDLNWNQEKNMSLSSLCGSLRSNWGPWAWWQLSLFNEPSQLLPLAPFYTVEKLRLRTFVLKPPVSA